MRRNEDTRCWLEGNSLVSHFLAWRQIDYLQDIGESKKPALNGLNAAVILEAWRTFKVGSIHPFHPGVRFLSKVLVKIIQIRRRLHAEGEAAWRNVFTIEVVQSSGTYLLVHLAFDLGV